ncbi:MAG: hypothetical protein R3D98_12065 [Candidatus Krumholzibacteriia bacterium]
MLVCWPQQGLHYDLYRHEHAVGGLSGNGLGGWATAAAMSGYRTLLYTRATSSSVAGGDLTGRSVRRPGAAVRLHAQGDKNRRSAATAS